MSDNKCSAPKFGYIVESSAPRNLSSCAIKVIVHVLDSTNRNPSMNERHSTSHEEQQPCLDERGINHTTTREEERGVRLGISWRCVMHRWPKIADCGLSQLLTHLRPTMRHGNVRNACSHASLVSPCRHVISAAFIQTWLLLFKNRSYYHCDTMGSQELWAINPPKAVAENDSGSSQEAEVSLISPPSDKCRPFRMRREPFRSAEAFTKLHSLRESRHLTDISFFSGTNEIHAHKVVLAATIPYFYAAFTNPVQAQEDMTALNLDYISVNHLVSYSYTGRLTVPAENVRSLMVTAHALQMDDVKEKCAECIISWLTPSNALDIRELCRQLECSKAVDECNRFIQKFFIPVSRSKSFLTIPLNEVLEILAMNEIFVDTEEVVFEAAMRWAAVKTKREQYTPKLLACVRLSLLKLPFLVDVVSKHRLIINDLSCRDQVDEAKNCYLPLDGYKFPKKQNPRLCTHMPGLICIIGGFTGENKPQNTFSIYNPMTKQWTNAATLKYNRAALGLAVEYPKIYAVCGVGSDARGLECYDFSAKQWQTLSSPSVKRMACVAAILDGKLYAMGGYDDSSYYSSVEVRHPNEPASFLSAHKVVLTNKGDATVYDPEKRSWSSCSSMNEIRTYAAATVLHGYVYVMGGSNRSYAFESVERFSPANGKWEKMPPMSAKRRSCAAATMNGKIYVCGGECEMPRGNADDAKITLDSVECFITSKSSWVPMPSMNQKRSGLSLLASGDTLYAIGGSCGTTPITSMEIYQESTNKWELVDLHKTVSYAGVASAPMTASLLFDPPT